MNRHKSQRAGPKGTKMVFVVRVHGVVQQNHDALHLSLRGRNLRNSLGGLRRHDVVARDQVCAVAFGDASAVRTKMMSRRLLGTLFLSWACAACLQAQEASPIPVQSPAPESDPALAHRPAAIPSTDTAKPATIPLTVPTGTPIQLALDEEIRIRKV